MSKLTGTDWPCVKCGKPLGRTIRGELVLGAGIRANTDGTRLVTQCSCGALKTWWAKDSAVMAEFGIVLIRLLDKLKQLAEAANV